jgi:hypothetical protein
MRVEMLTFRGSKGFGFSHFQPTCFAAVIDKKDTIIVITFSYILKLSALSTVLVFYFYLWDN